MHHSCIRLLALFGFLWILLTSGSTAQAQLPPIGTPSCPPNTSCAPGMPPISPPVTCGPGNGGAPCGGAGPAALESSTGINVGAGNPINLINGNKYQREVDMAPLPGTLGLEIVRHYNSAFSRPGASNNLLGRGWKLSYETDLYVTSRTVQIVQADGRRIIFNRDPRDLSQCASADPSNGTVSIVKTGRGEEYTWRWTDGRALNFDSRGKLVQILAPNGQFVSLQHDRAGLLVKVTDPQGRSLNLSYLDKARARAGDAFRGVQNISSPVGRFTYHYGSPMPKGAGIDKRLLLASLVKVTMPTGQRYYHYEDARFPTLLTGISELATAFAAESAITSAAGEPARLAWQRMSTYGYDANGKANLSVRGLPARLARDTAGRVLHPVRLAQGTGIDQVTLDFSKGGRTTVTNALGQPTVFRHAIIGGEYRLLDVRGAGCADCGPTNVHYRYDDLGRLVETTTLAADGTPLAGTRTELDARGRPLATSKIAYRNGRPGAPQWQNRFEYTGDVAQPTRVLRPSVVDGKEAAVTIAYVASGAATGLPLSVTEDGFVPSADARVSATAITRTINYRYNGYGERSLIDGPLPNASKGASPANSDLTVTEFDPATKLPVRIRHPGNRVEEVLERDAALRPRVVRSSDGPVVRTITATLNWRGQAERVESAGAPAVRYRYDVNGRLLAMQEGDAAEIRFAYDAGGRMVARILSDGSRAPVRIAQEGTAPGTAPPAAVIDHDWLSRPVAWRAGNGAVAVQTSWGASGSAAQASVLSINAGDARAERMIDDFGRVSAIRNPGQGWQRARHDPAGRIVDSVDARGARQRAEWDAGGRLLKLVRYAPGRTAAEQTLTYRYTGSLLLEQEILDADGVRLTRNEYDTMGRILSQALSITPSRQVANALPHVVTMRYRWRYDAGGRLVGRSFADHTGATFALTESLDGQGRTSGIATHGVLPAALGGRRVIAAAIGWQDMAAGPFAQRIVHGDGSVEQFDAPARPAAPDAPHLRQASLDMAGAAMLRQPPGRNADAAGLPADITTVEADQRLEWNVAGQLTRSTRAGGSTRYLYDASGQRVARIITDAQGRARTTLFFHHDHQLVAETDAGGHMQYAYVYLGRRPLAQADLRPQGSWDTFKRWLFGAPVRHLHTDRAGRVMVMTQDGNTVWRDSEAFGPRVLHVSTKLVAKVHQPLRYVSQYFDDDSGLSYHGLRYFDPGSARFLSPDPAGIADALHGVPAPLLLDLYAYAGGRPEEFFDPDGAARIRYFAITTDAKGKTLGTDQGFTQARWAFIIDNVKAGVPTSALGQKQNEYAQNGTSLLVDASGNFLKENTVAATWNRSGSQEDAFRKHYGEKLFSIPEFTIEMSDGNAATLIATYIPNDRQLLFSNTCPPRSSLLPQIKFAKEEANINVSDPTANGGQKQRILACGDRSGTNLEQRRIAKYEAAAEVNETGRINRDCSTGGCPGIAYFCNTTKCSAINQLLRGKPDTKEPVYTPSYGRSQFVTTTLVSELLAGYNSFPKDILIQLGLSPEMKESLQNMAKRGALMLNWWDRTKPAINYADAGNAWADLSAANQKNFAAETGLGMQAYIDMVRIKTTPPVNSNGDDLSGDARQALATSAIMQNADDGKFLMSILENFDRFTVMSHALMRKNLHAALQFRSNASEEYLAAMVARAHNGGKWERTYDQLIKRDQFDYVKNFIGIGARFTGAGDWNSLRCTENFGSNTVKPGTEGKGVGGLYIKPLKLP